MKPGDYGLTTIGGVTGFFVNIGQALLNDSSRFTHAFIVLDDGNVLEAMPGGAQINPLSKHIKKPVIYSSIDLTDAQRNSILMAARKLKGTPYSFIDYFALALHNFGLHPAWMKKRIGDSGHMICSQLVDEVYLRAGVHLFDDGRWPGFVTPGDLMYVILDNR